ncbi:MAG: hypothetical protein IPL78_02130 [Chloroflexi bacterium]|nr:hypothetical protein [Chloroflexota bacterium]
MMNPFTRFLSRNQPDKALNRLIEQCDRLEALVIRVFKGNEATQADEQEYAALRAWFQANYANWQDKLKPHWQQVLAGGKPPEQDPVLRLLAAAAAHDFVGDWGAMQHLPAVREALNRFIVAQDR